MTAETAAHEGGAPEVAPLDEFQTLLDLLGYPKDAALFLSNAVMGDDAPGTWNDLQVRCEFAAEKAAELSKLGRDVWWTPAEFPKKGAGRKSRLAINLRALHLDTDFAANKLRSEENCRTLIDNLSGLGMPSAIVHTGGGLHPYWRLTGKTDNPVLAALVLKRFSLWARSVARDLDLGTIDTTSDLARVLRVPGTWNRKPEYPEPRQVWLELCEDGDTLDITEVAQFLDEAGIIKLTAADVTAEMRDVEYNFAAAGSVCGYFTKFVQESLVERPDKRHVWLVNKFVRLNVAAAKGCVDESTFEAVAKDLGKRFEAMCADGTFEEGYRRPSRGEMESAWDWAQLKAGGKSKEQQDAEWPCEGGHEPFDPMEYLAFLDRRKTAEPSPAEEPTQEPDAAPETDEERAERLQREADDRLRAWVEGHPLSQTAQDAAMAMLEVTSLLSALGRFGRISPLDEKRMLGIATQRVTEEMITARRVKEPEPLAPGREMLSIADLRGLDAPDQLVDTYLQFPGVLLVPGWRGSYKSFLTLDWAAHVALGVPWHGKEVRKERVLYAVGEGAVGMKVRARAWELHHGMDMGWGDGITLVRGRSLWDPESGRPLMEPIRRAAVDGGYRFIVLDTLSSLFTGADENSGVDMPLLMRALVELSEEIAGTVMLVHHIGKDAKRGARGHSSLEANADQVVQVSADPDVLGVRASTRIEDSGKSKDSAPWVLEGVMKLVETDILDRAGRPMTSLVMERLSTATPGGVMDMADVMIVKVARNVLERNVDPMTTRAIMSAVGWNPEDGGKRSALNSALNREVKPSGGWLVKEKAGRTVYWSVAP